jgi:ribosome maturation factor RimP
VRDYRKIIQELIEPAISAEKMEVVEVECLKMKTRWLVRIYIDKEGGVTLDDCRNISRLAGDILDVHEIPPGPYTLEVSSPGLDRPLTRDKDFARFTGEKIAVKTKEKIEGSRNFRGILVGYEEEAGEKTVVLDIEGKTLRIPQNNILKAHLEYQF